MDKLRRIRDEIAALDNVLYLNWGGSGPSPERVVRAECRAIRTLNDGHGPMSVTALQAAAEMLVDARQALANLLGCQHEEIALMESTSDGINRIAWGIDWQPDDEVIITDNEHISGIAPWNYLQEQRGIRPIVVATRAGHIDVADIMAHVTPRTRLVFVSHVSYITGAVLPIAQLAKEADAHGFWLGVDGAQSIGALPVNLTDLGAHFYAFPGQKWLLGPDGTGGFYVRRDVLEQLKPSYVGWASLHEDALHGGGSRFHSSARRFEVAGRRVPAFVALTEAARIIRDIGLDVIQDRIRVLTHYFTKQLAEIPGVKIVGRPGLVADHQAEDVSGLVSVDIGAADPVAVVETLWSEYDIVARWVGNPPLLRFSFHAFNTEDDIDRLMGTFRLALGKVN